MAQLTPTRDRLDRPGRPPLDRARAAVLDTLSLLDDSWSVWVSPRLELDRPDFVVAHDRYGITVIVVADADAETPRRNEGGFVEYRGDDGQWHRDHRQPRVEAKRIADRIGTALYRMSDPSLPLDAVRSVVLAPHLDSAAARGLFALADEAPPTTAVAVWGGDALPRSVSKIVTGLGCAEPDAAGMRRIRDVLDTVAPRPPAMVLTRSAGVHDIATNPTRATRRRIAGEPATGKSTALAARAAHLALAGRRSLFVGFSSTIPASLRANVAARCAEIDADPTLVTVTSFHEFCAHVVDDGGLGGVSTTADPKTRWPVAIVERAGHVLRDPGPIAERYRYDAVLVDDAQDFEPAWCTMLRDLALVDGGEMVIAFDPTQNIYDRGGWPDVDSADGWAEFGFDAPWVDLADGPNTPLAARDLYRAMRDRLDDVPVHVPSWAMAIEPDAITRSPADGTGRNVEVRWIDLDRVVDLGQTIGNEVVRILREHPELSPRDVSFVCDYHHDGVTAAGLITRAGYPVHHVFSRDPAERQVLKRRFALNADAVTGATVHSLKGSHSRAVVMSIGNDDKSRQLAAIAVTRVIAPGDDTAVLVVVNGDSALRSLGASFHDSANASPPGAAPAGDAATPPAAPIHVEATAPAVAAPSAPSHTEPVAPVTAVASVAAPPTPSRIESVAPAATVAPPPPPPPPPLPPSLIETIAATTSPDLRSPQ